jgi:membrane protease YdiL (CAAX protease family)
MSKDLKIILITAISFGLYFALREAYFADLRSWLNEYVHSIAFSHFLTYLLLGLPLLLGVGLMHGFRAYWEKVGLNRSVLKGFLFALLCTLPMLIGYALVFDFNSEITARQIIAGALVAAFIEELFYRGILFGQLFRFTRLGFIPSVLFGALIFASAHLYQSQDFSTLIGIFLTTFMGGVWFAWVYVEWENNLWVAIFLHLLMNLFWMLFAVSDNALGNQWGNVFRIATIALVVMLTLRYKKQKGLKLTVNRNTLWIKKLPT